MSNDHDDNHVDFTPDEFHGGDVMEVRYQELRQILRAMYALQIALDPATDIKRNFTFMILECEFNTIAAMLRKVDSDAIEDQVHAYLERRAYTASSN